MSPENPTPPSPTARRRLTALIPLAGVVFAAVWLLSRPAGSQATGDVNVIRSIRLLPAAQRGAPREVAVELHSSRPFPARARLPVLRIGAREYPRSRYPDDGSMNTLIFMLPETGFRAAITGEPVVVDYGGRAAGDRWDFGKLDTSLLK